jgi:SAM-dependent methyltransferase
VPVFDYDAELRRYHPVFLDACRVEPGDVVLDIGCGAGRSTLDLARAAGRGSALGVDLSVPALATARARAGRENAGNVAFQRADVQRHPFPAGHFDLAISRFGTMFFDDPLEAFTNIARCLRPAGRLVMLVWQAAEHQEWVTAIHRGLGADASGMADASPFSLADPDTVRGLLDAAGFTGVGLADLREPLYYGQDTDSAYDAVLTLRMATDLLAGRTEADRRDALARLRAELARYETDDGVWFDSRAWLVTARR